MVRCSLPTVKKMIPRPLAAAGLLGAAIGVPYAVTNSPEGLPSSFSWPGATASAEDPAATTPTPVRPTLSAPPGPGSEVYSSNALLEGPRNVPVAQLLNWNITKEWVYRNWARKSTGLADANLYGVRVPVVTGSRMTDLAGALSYYFDARGQLQRIRFHGRTADTTELLRVATTQFGMTPRAAMIAGEQLLQATEEERLRSELKTRPESVLWSTAPHQSFVVDMELNRPGSEYWVVQKPMHLQLAGLDKKDSDPTKPQGEGDPIFPPRAVVPDSAPNAIGASAAQSPPPSQAPEASSAGAETSSQVAPTAEAKKEVDTAPLRSYRSEFRWPD